MNHNPPEAEITSEHGTRAKAALEAWASLGLQWPPTLGQPQQPNHE